MLCSRRDATDDENHNDHDEHQNAMFFIVTPFSFSRARARP
jgi:hypothetical protein